MRPFYILGSLVACLSVASRAGFDALSISNEHFLEVRDLDAKRLENDYNFVEYIGFGSKRSRGGGSSSGGSGGKSSRGDISGRKSTGGYGNNPRPDRSQDKTPPPPYSRQDNSPPPPYSPGSYGQRGPSRSYWNGQYYPYGAYGYGGFFPFLGLGAAAPFLLAGPFGLYGHYSAGNRDTNCTIKNYYVNGTRDNSGSPEINLVNGTYYELIWEDSTYTLRSQAGGVYKNAQILELDKNIAVNGTYEGDQKWETKTINPNISSNGTTLDFKENSGPASLELPSIYVSIGVITVALLI